MYWTVLPIARDRRSAISGMVGAFDTYTPPVDLRQRYGWGRSVESRAHRPLTPNRLRAVPRDEASSLFPASPVGLSGRHASARPADRRSPTRSGPGAAGLLRMSRDPA